MRRKIDVSLNRQIFMVTPAVAGQGSTNVDDNPRCSRPRDLPFPSSLPEFQSCSERRGLRGYMEAIRCESAGYC